MQRNTRILRFWAEGEPMEERGRKEARKILEGLGFKHIEEIGNIRTPHPYDMSAKKGEEQFLIEVKYVEKPEDEPLSKSRNTGGFPFPWICRAKEVVSKGQKALVMVIAKREDRVSYLFLEPRFEKPWFKCEFIVGLDYTSP